jgi:hypothetical protein
MLIEVVLFLIYYKKTPKALEPREMCEPFCTSIPSLEKTASETHTLRASVNLLISGVLGRYMQSREISMRCIEDLLLEHIIMKQRPKFASLQTGKLRSDQLFAVNQDGYSVRSVLYRRRIEFRLFQTCH